MFDAPGLVKHVLNNEARLSEAYVGTRETQPLVERFFAEAGRVGSLWTPESQYR